MTRTVLIGAMDAALRIALEQALQRNGWNVVADWTHDWSEDQTPVGLVAQVGFETALARLSTGTAVEILSAIAPRDDLAIDIRAAELRALAVRRAPHVRVNAVAAADTAEPDDVAVAAAFLLATEAITGQLLIADRQLPSPLAPADFT